MNILKVRPWTIIIDKFQIFPNGLLVDTKSFVESADLFLDDVIQWGIKTFGLRILEDPPIRKAFVSHLEVKLDSSPLAALAGPLGNKLMACLKSYGVECPPMEGSNLSIHCDTTNMPAPVPSSFSFERRAGFPYSSNIYFSAAPLTTLDHLKILSTF